jgi:hypothetical protein
MNSISGVDFDIAVKPDSKSLNSLNSWRSDILENSIGILSNPFQNEVQRLTNMWKGAESLNYPPKESISVLPNGCLVFDIALADQVVHYSVWLTFGEIRIGVKVPNLLITSDDLHEKLNQLFDGNACSRIVKTEQHTVFDWIFREGFASHEYMVTAVRDLLAATIISIRIGEILTHIYLSSLSFLIEANHNFLVSYQAVQNRRDYDVIFNGDMDSFIFFATSRLIRVLDAQLQTDGSMLARVSIPASTPDLNMGVHGDQDGGIFVIDSINKVG